MMDIADMIRTAAPDLVLHSAHIENEQGGKRLIVADFRMPVDCVQFYRANVDDDPAIAVAAIVASARGLTNG